MNEYYIYGKLEQRSRQRASRLLVDPDSTQPRVLVPCRVVLYCTLYGVSSFLFVSTVLYCIILNNSAVLCAAPYWALLYSAVPGTVFYFTLLCSSEVVLYWEFFFFIILHSVFSALMVDKRFSLHWRKIIMDTTTQWKSLRNKLIIGSWWTLTYCHSPFVPYQFKGTRGSIGYLHVFYLWCLCLACLLCGWKCTDS